MSDFSVEVVRVGSIEPIPEADRIEVARVGGYQSIVAKGQFRAGDLAVYIEEGSVVPDNLIQEMNLVGKLHGSGKNRVKAIKLRGILSQGLLYTQHPWPSHWVEEYDTAEELGITKYVVPVPTMFYAGNRVKLTGGMLGKTVHYDINNIKKYPNVFEEGEPVVFTEKVHGTHMMLVRHPDVPSECWYNGWGVASKGLGARGILFQQEQEEQNVYLRVFHERRLSTASNTLAYYLGVGDSPMYIFGEVFGLGIQDLTYGLSGPDFRVFDCYIGHPGRGYWLDADVKYGCFKHAGLTSVPILYRGPYSHSVLSDYTDGDETIGSGSHMREGIVITPAMEREHHGLGRLVLKSVSEAYLLRKNATEYV